MYSRGFCLLIRVSIYQNVQSDTFVSKMHDANLFSSPELQAHKVSL